MKKTISKIISVILSTLLIAVPGLSFSGCSAGGEHLGQASIVTASSTISRQPEQPAPQMDSESERGSEEQAEPKTDVFAGGAVNVDVVTASVTIDGKDIIRDVKLDKYEIKVDVDKNGCIVGDLSTDGVVGARELKYDYGMKSASKLSLEWFEQVENFEKWAIGKTVDELLGMKTVYIDEERPSVPGEPDLNVSVSISVGDFLKAIRAAAINAGWDPDSDVVFSSESSEQQVDYSIFFEDSAVKVELSSDGSIIH